MLIDARRLRENTVITADVCIVGAGPAGITLARELRRRSVGVCLVAGGGVGRDRESQSLASIPAVGGDLRFPAESRFRQFGGTATEWNAPIPGHRQGVRMRPLDPIDFKERDWVPDSGWPFQAAELAAYYEDAQRLLGLRPTGVATGPWPATTAPWPLDTSRVRTTIDQFARRRTLVETRARELVDADDAHVILWASAIRLGMHPDQRGVEQLELACLGGERHSVRSPVFVLATGGIENARLLLLSGETARGGVGNGNDLVGRFFMDHVWAPLGEVTLSDPAAFARSALYDIRQVEGYLIGGRLQLSEQVMESERLLNGGIGVTPQLSPQHARALEGLRYLHRRRGESSGYVDALRRVARSARDIGVLTAELAWQQRRFPPTLSSGWSRLRRGGHRLPGFALEMQLELPPRHENRVVLTERRDALGMSRAGVHYEFREDEYRTLTRTRAIVAAAIKDSGIGSVDTNREMPPLAPAASIHHHMGTTRMHESPKRGVVDPNGRVHGLANLYIAGSSVFPTGGFANPTLTIVALALRLAAHLTATAPAS